MIARLFPLLDRTASLKGLVQERLGESGVEHPLTAVLLNFRGYDTMLEIGVLLVAVLAVWALEGRERPRWRLIEPSRRSPVLRVALGILAPTMVVAAGYMVWVGAYRPGGAFQAGTILGALMVVLVGSGVVPLPLSRTSGVRLALGAGFFLFLLAAVLPSLAGGKLLEYPQGFEGLTILVIESMLSLSIGASIGTFIAGVAAPRKSGCERSGEL
jgi:multisubunit Na+/H+ antiporter MnhB subunit